MLNQNDQFNPTLPENNAPLHGSAPSSSGERTSPQASSAQPVPNVSLDKSSAPATSPKKWGGCSCTTMIIVALIAALVLSCAITCCVAFSSMSSGFSSSIDTTTPSFTYKLVEKAPQDTVKHKVVILPITGTISSNSGDGVGEFADPENLKYALDYLGDDEEVAAVILEVNSPGGGLTASDMMLHMLKEYKKKSQVPIYAYFVDEACSGGYYVSMVSDQIYACPTTMTGSIGVIMQLPEISGLMDKCGIKMVTIASLNSEGKASYKDIGSMFRTMKPDERAMLQSMITESWEGFVQVVSEGRQGKLTKDQVKKIADGRIFSAKQALKAKVIDGICYPDELYAKVRKELKDVSAEETAVVRLGRETSLMDSLNSLKLTSLLHPLNQAPSLPHSERPQRYYFSPVRNGLE